MKNLKEIIKESYKNINSNFLSFIKDIKNIKEIGFKPLWEKNKFKLVIMILSILVIFIFLLSSFSLSKEEILNKFESALINEN